MWSWTILRNSDQNHADESHLYWLEVLLSRFSWGYFQCLQRAVTVFSASPLMELPPLSPGIHESVIDVVVVLVTVSRGWSGGTVDSKTYRKVLGSCQSSSQILGLDSCQCRQCNDEKCNYSFYETSWIQTECPFVLFYAWVQEKLSWATKKSFKKYDFEIWSRKFVRLKWKRAHSPADRLKSIWSKRFGFEQVIWMFQSFYAHINYFHPSSFFVLKLDIWSGGRDNSNTFQFPCAHDGYMM